MQNPVFQLQPLSWPKNALQPFLSSQNLTMLYDVVYKSEVDQMNLLAQEYPELKSMNLTQIMRNYLPPIRNVAAEILNHQFFFRCLSPSGNPKSFPSGRLFSMLVNQFRSFENFISEFSQRAISHFGSGWIWLVYDPTSTFLFITNGDNAYNPIIDGHLPLLALDVWEHAYYCDYGVDKRRYVENFWSFVNWQYMEDIAAEQIFNYQVRVAV